MAYINNQYIRLDESLEEIAKIEIKTDKNNNKLIEELELKDYPNVVIACGEKVEYDNIFGGVKILITDKNALEKNEYKIPEYIEKIIVYGYVYENNNRGIERLKNGNELIGATMRYNNKLALEILEREEININQADNYGNTALIIASNNMESVVLKLLERKEININQVNKNGETALMWACKNMESVALKLLEREEININQVNKYGETALIWACMNNMEKVALKLLERDNINVNHRSMDGHLALECAIENNMTNVINRINELNNR